MEDISTILAFEVKKELASRYFGFRKIIEDDTATYRQQIIASSLKLENEIGEDLVEIYTLLQNETLIEQFLNSCDFKDKLFFDNYVHINPTRKKKLFSCCNIRGFTRKGRIRNALLDSYQSLFQHVTNYNDSIKRLCSEHDTIREQINIFYQKNDLTGIMQFLGSLDSNSSTQASSTMAIHSLPKSFNSMEEKMRIKPPVHVSKLLPNLPTIPDCKLIKKTLIKLADLSCQQHQDLDPRTFCK